LGGLGGIGGLGGLAGGLGRNRLGGNNQNQSKSTFRAAVRPDVVSSQERRPNVSSQLQQRLSRVPLPERLRGVRATYEDGNVVLRGSVATEADKRMMERLVQLEPGVDSVRNEVAVQQPTLEQIQANPNR
jgi:osmotically-inducible protein OsmY